MKNNSVFRFLAAAFAAATLSVTAHATTFVKDVMVIGGSKSEVNDLKTTYTGQGWTVINSDLNSGAGGDYVYLLVKWEADTSGTRDYVTGFYIKSGASGVNNTLTSGGKTYALTTYDGGSHFKSVKGDLNSNTGENSASIHLYYTRDTSGGKAVSSITFNATQTGALGENGGSTGYDLNKGCGADTDYIYMHIGTEFITYAITYNLYGGTLPSGYPTEYTAQSAFTLKSPTRAGYNFAGWTWSGQTTPQTAVTVPAGSTGNRSYTANWTPITYSIGYTLNGGSLPSGYPTSYNIESAAITLKNPSRTGYNFAGWTWSGQSTPQTSVTIAHGSTGAKSYTANWTPVNYTISYTLNNGTLPSSHPTSYNIESANFSLVNPTRTGYNFAGWTGTGLSSAQTTVTISKGSTGSRTYTANWTPVTYTIGYNLNYGTLPSGYPTSYNIESANFSLVNPTRTGYNFAGWTGTGLSSAQTSVTIPRGSTGNKTYTANWTPRTTTFVFNSNGGAGSMASQTFTTALPQNLRANTFTREAYIFTGWNTSGDGTGTPYDDGQSLTIVATNDSQTLYAQWVPVVCEIDTGSNEVVLIHGQTLVGTGGANTRVIISAGATVTLSNVTLTATSGSWAGITCLGEASLGIVGVNAVSSGDASHAGIQTGPNGTTLTIWGDGHLDVSSVNGNAIGGASIIAIADGLAVTVAGAESPAPYTGRIAACAEAAVAIGLCVHDGGAFEESGHKYCEFCGMPKRWADGAGTAESPWQIATTADWNELAAAVNEGFDTEGRFFLMTDDIGNVTATVGSSANAFLGVFNGGGHALGVEIVDTANPGTAPFRCISGATISNLTVSGTVVGSTHASGLVGFSSGTAASLIADCTVDVAVSVPATSGNRHMGGVVGHGGNSVLTIRDTLFCGTMSSTGSYAGGLQGWSDGNTLTISNCLFSGTYTGEGAFHPVAIHNSGSSTAADVVGAYYTESPTLSDAGFIAADGTKVFASVPSSVICRAGSVRGVDFFIQIPVDVSGLQGEYEYQDGQPVDVRFTVSIEGNAATEGVQYSSAFLRYGDPVSTVAGRGSYELVVTGNAAHGFFGSLTIPFRVDGLDQAADGAYLIASASDFAELAQLVEDGFETAGKTFRMAADVSGATAMVGTEDNPFRGVFDGAGRTLGIAINDATNQGAAPFRNIAGATISNLVVTGSVVGEFYPAGLVSFSRSGENLVMGCVVNADVSNSASSYNSDRHVSGVVGHGCASTLTIRDTVFGGTVFNEGISAGGFMSSSDDYMVLTISNCVFSGRYTGYGDYFQPIATKGQLRWITATVVDAFRTEWAAPTLIDNAWFMIDGVADLVVSTEPPSNSVYRVVSTPAGDFYYTCEVSGVSPGYPASAVPVMPELVVSDNRGALVAGTDYDLSYANNTAEGVGTVTVTGRGSYCGSQTIEFEIGDTIEIGSDTTKIGGDVVYKVSQDVTLCERLVVVGSARLLLCDNTTLTAPKGITVADGNALEILAESDGENMGALVATAEGVDDAGIGGTVASPDSGSITIRGGRVTASCRPTSANNYSYGAGIGGGKRGGSKVLIAGGVVNATGSHGAGIGEGSDAKYKNNEIRITGGVVTASIGIYGYAAGIGHGGWYEAGWDNTTLIEITGGTVNASGCAGIGGAGGSAPNIAPHVRITGGVVTASGTRNFAIGAGGENHAAGTIEILGGQVVANGAIGGDYKITPNTWYVSDLTISLGPDDFVTASAYVVNTITLDGEYRLERAGQPDVIATSDNIREGGTVSLLVGGACYVSFLDDDGTTEFASVGVPSGITVAPIGLAPMRTGYVFSGWTMNGVPYDFSSAVTESFSLVASYSAAPPLSYLDGSGATVTTSAYRTILQQDDALTLDGGVYVLGEDVTTARRVTVSADTVLVLRNGTVFTADHGVEILPAASLEICGQDVGEGETAGAIVASANESNYPGIGYMSSHASGKGIAIRGGIVTAQGGGQAAGIGGGRNWQDPAAPNIVISGGTVTATGGNQGAGIGSGMYGNGGSITISGGVVTATGGRNGGAGIGGADYTDGGTIVISGGIVTATGIRSAAGIGASESACCSITISGGTVTAQGGTSGSAGIGGSLYNGSSPRDGGTITITGGKVTVLASNNTCGIGGSTAGGATAILLDWTNPDSDFIASPVYNGTVSILSPFKLDGTVPPVAATVENIAGHKIVPDFSFSACVPGSGTESDPYRIGTVKQWNAFTFAGTSGLDTAGRHFLLEAGLSVSSRFAGVFQGTFDGGGHTLTVSYDEDAWYVAPFATISNATIRSLAVAGTISGGYHCAGIAGYTSGGENLIEDCEVSAAIATSESHCGGFIGHGGVVYAPVSDTLRGCVFSGSISGGQTVGTFVGWSDEQSGNTASVALVDCFDRSDSTHPIGRGTGTVSVSNAYYTVAAKATDGLSSWDAASSGRRVCTLSVGDGVEMYFGTPGAAYSTTGISVFDNCVVRSGVRYCVVGSEFDVHATGEKGRHHVCVVTDGAGNDISATVLDGTTFTMPDMNAAIARVTLDPADVTLSSATGAVALYDGDTLTGKGGSGTHIIIADGATVTFCDVDLSDTEGGWAGVTCLGDATIILEGDSAVISGDASHPAVQAGPAGTTLAIQGSGSLSAAGGTAAISVVAGGELSLADGLMVTVVGGTTPAAYADRAAACGETAVAIAQCVHGGGVFEDVEGASHCEFCGTEVFVMDGGSGTADDPWIIRTTKAWDNLASGVASEIVTNLCFVRLDADITVTNMIGSWSHPFTGVFNGGGHKLTLNLNSSVDYVAPFSVISGTVISNLVSAGSVNGGMHCAGLVGCAFATNLIENCLVSTKVTSTGSHCGGVLGNGCLSSTTIAGCVFSGSIPSGLTAGTLWGWSDPGSEATLIDCYASSVNYHPIGRGANSSRRVENVYYYLYTSSGGSYAWNSDELGKCAHTVSRDFGVTIDFGDPVTSYGTSKLVAYAHGFAYSGNFFAGAGDVIPMSLSSNSGVSSPEFIVEEGLLVRDGDLWILTMPDASVVIKEKPPAQYEVVLPKVEHAAPDSEICVNGNWSYTYSAVSNAQVTAVYVASGPAWTIESFTVVAEDGTTVPCTMERLHLGEASVSFRMPGMSVTVTPTVVPTSCTAMSLGVNEIGAAGMFSFVAPTNGVYSFTLGNTTDWHYEALDEMWMPPNNWAEDQLILIGGQTYYFLLEGNGAGTTMTVEEIDTVDAYSVEVVQAEHGTVVASVSEAPEGSHVYFTVKPDRGWVSYYADAFDADGNKVDLNYNFDGSQCYIVMPASAVSFEAHFDRDYNLYVGENPILFENNMPNCIFIAPSDGYYRFRSTCGVYPYIDIDSNGGYVTYKDSEPNGDFDCVVRMQAGMVYYIYVGFNSGRSVSVEAEIIVSKCAVHSVSVDEDIPHGTISVVDEHGYPVAEATEGSQIRLAAEPSDGYEFGGWNVVDESGASVEVLWNDNSDYWYFKMPGTNVFVSATFGEPNYITAFSSGPESVDSIFINGVWSDSWSAVEGAKVAVVYWVTPGWDPSMFSVVDENGANIPYTVKIDPEDPTYAYVTFTMPNADVNVSPVLSRADCPTLAIGVNTIDDAGTWNFVAPEDGEYSFAFADTSEWYGTLYDDWGMALNGTYNSDVFVVGLAKGNVCHLQMERSYDALPNEVTVTKTDGVVVPHTVLFNAEHCTVLTNAAALPEGYILAFEIHPEPGYEVADIVVEDADGSGVSIYSYEELYYFFMPETNVTVNVTLTVPLPRYIARADDDVTDNYYAWAAKYGPDPLGTNEVAFLLDIDPATPIPEGAALLKVTDFSVSPTNIHFEIASDVAEFELKDIGEGDYSWFLGNGYPQIEFRMSLSRDWISLPPIPVRVVNGRGIIDMDAGGVLPPGLFFRVSIIAGALNSAPILE